MTVNGVPLPIDEGFQWARFDDRGVLQPTLGQQTLVRQSRQHMRVLEVVVVVRTEDVGRHDRGEVAAVLFVVGTVGNVDHTLSVGVPKVGVVRGTVVDHGFVDGIGSLVGEDAGRET